MLRRLYRPLYLIEAPIVFTGIETAELTKYAANAFLAMKVTFINEIADLCEKVGADVHDVARGIGLDGRIGRKFLHPGPGYGGSCFPKDTLALVRTAQDFGAPSRLVETVVAVNDARKATMAMRVINACGGSVRGKTIAVLGLTFKPETDDMRDAPSISIVSRLVGDGAVVRAFDPEGMQQARAVLPEEVVYCRDALDAADGRGRTGADHRMERVPRAAAGPPVGGDAREGDRRSAQRLRSGGDARGRRRLPLHRTAGVMGCGCTSAAPSTALPVLPAKSNHGERARSFRRGVPLRRRPRIHELVGMAHPQIFRLFPSAFMKRQFLGVALAAPSPASGRPGALVPINHRHMHQSR